MSGTGPVLDRYRNGRYLYRNWYHSVSIHVAPFCARSNAVLPEFDHQNVFCAHWYILEVGAPYVVMHNGSHMTLAPFKKVAAEGGGHREWLHNEVTKD